MDSSTTLTFIILTLNLVAPARAAEDTRPLSHPANLHDVPISAVTLGDGLWKERFMTNAEVSIPAFFAQLEKAGALDKLRGQRNKARGNSDADLAKWLEAASLVLQSQQNRQLHDLMEEVIDDVLLSSRTGGYLHKRYMIRMPAELANLRPAGYLYCLGHWLQAAIAYYQATGDECLLDVFVPYIDNVIENFGPGKKICWSGHPEIELALVELYRIHSEEKYLQFAHYLLDEVDLSKEEKAQGLDLNHYFSGLPFTSRKTLRGHAVSAMYFCSAAAGYYIETGDKAMWLSLNALWHDLTQSKMYITGGVGSRPWSEEIGDAYELPNERGYAETCAAIGNIMWNWRLLKASGQARFADVMERTLYNGFLSGVSIDGRSYFYWNPLLSKSNENKEKQFEDGQDLLTVKKTTGVSLDVRQPYYKTPCCIPNVQRMIASLPGYMYSTSAEGAWIHLYHNSRVKLTLESGEELLLTQNTAYPWDGTVKIAFENAPAENFSLFLRIPYWAENATISVNNRTALAVQKPGTYHEIRRKWSDNDSVNVVFDMPIKMVHANPNVLENRGCVAIQRGPVVYCLESVDHETSIFDIVLPVDSEGKTRGLKAQFEPDLLGGVVAINGPAPAYGRSISSKTLCSFESFDEYLEPTGIKAIPYFAWANRGPSDMTVWITLMKKQ